MLHLLNRRPSVLRDRLSRREWLQVGGLSLAGLQLPSLLRAEDKSAAKKRPGKAKACIMLFLAGGPSHLDMWDMKPEAPAEIRGEFKPIATSVPGIQLSEHLPKLAREMHHCALIRSAHHKVANAHWVATHYAMTGEDRGDNAKFSRDSRDFPSMGAVFSHLRPPERNVVPHVSLPFITAEGAGGPPQPGIYGGWLGRAYDPLIITQDPNAPTFGIPELTLRADIDLRRMEERNGLRGQVERNLDRFARNESARMMDVYHKKALTLLTSDATRNAFDLTKEPLASRDAYGRNIYGQSVLLSRRLVEAGARMVTLKWAPDANATWDTHGNNFKKLKGELLPQLDASLGTLMRDLQARGLLEETLILVLGEFGRSPRVNGGAGRDHWPRCYSLLMAGGGVQGGAVYGKSDRIGSDPSENPVTPNDLIATFYSLLGIDPEIELPDNLGRPIKVGGNGRVIREVIA